MAIAPFRPTPLPHDFNTTNLCTEEINKKKESLDKLDKEIANLRSKIAFSKQTKHTHILTGIGIRQPNKTLNAQQQTLNGLEKKLAKKMRTVSWDSECDVFEIPHKLDRYPWDLLFECFWSQDETDMFDRQFNIEVKAYISKALRVEKKTVSPRQAMDALCQPTPGDLIPTKTS